MKYGSESGHAIAMLRDARSLHGLKTVVTVRRVRWDEFAGFATRLRSNPQAAEKMVRVAVRSQPNYMLGHPQGAVS